MPEAGPRRRRAARQLPVFFSNDECKLAAGEDLRNHFHMIGCVSIFTRIILGV
jgi:hypothetical protein